MQDHPSRHKTQRKIDFFLCCSQIPLNGLSAPPTTITLPGGKSLLFWSLSVWWPWLCGSGEVKPYFGNTVMIFWRQQEAPSVATRQKKFTVIGLSRKMQAFIQMMEWTRLGSRVDPSFWDRRQHSPYEYQIFFPQKAHWRCWVGNPGEMCLYQTELFSVDDGVLAVIKKIYNIYSWTAEIYILLLFTHEIKQVY